MMAKQSLSLPRMCVNFNTLRQNISMVGNKLKLSSCQTHALPPKNSTPARKSCSEAIRAVTESPDSVLPIEFDDAKLREEIGLIEASSSEELFKETLTDTGKLIVLKQRLEDQALELRYIQQRINSVNNGFKTTEC